MNELIELNFDCISSIEKKNVRIAELEIDRDTFKHGYRIAIDSCVQMERQLAEARNQVLDKALLEAKEPHPPSRGCMCADCAPSFEDIAQDADPDGNEKRYAARDGTAGGLIR